MRPTATQGRPAGAPRRPSAMRSDPPELSRRARVLIARIRRDSGDVEAVKELEAHYAEVGDYGSLANLLAGWAEILKDGRAAADALIRGADAILIGLGDRERACMFLEHALTRCPAHEGAMHQLSQLLAQAKDHERLRHCMRRVTAELDGEVQHSAYQASIEFRLGKLYEDVFEQSGKAVLHYRRAIELVPTMLPAIIAARRIYADAGDHSAVASLLEFEIRATGADEDRVPLLAALARCQRDKLHNHDEAVRALRKGLQLQPHNAALLIELAETLASRRGDSREHPNDGPRAAELYYQAARLMPEQEATALLDSALQQDPTHAAAQRWRAQLGAPPIHPSSVPAPKRAEQPLPAPPARPGASAPRRASAPPAPRRASILPPAPDTPSPDAETTAATPLTTSELEALDVEAQVATPVGASAPPPSATAPPPSATAPPSAAAPPSTAASFDEAAPIDDEPTRIAPTPFPDADDGDDATRISPIPPAPVPDFSAAPAIGADAGDSTRAEVHEWLATPASDTTPLDTQGLRPIDGATLSDPPPPPTATPPLRTGATGPSRPVKPASKELVDRMARLRSRLKRRSSVAPPPVTAGAPMTQEAPVQSAPSVMPSAPIPSAPIPSAPMPSAPIPSAPIPSAPIPSAPMPSAPMPSAPMPSAMPSAPMQDAASPAAQPEVTAPQPGVTAPQPAAAAPQPQPPIEPALTVADVVAPDESPEDNLRLVTSLPPEPTRAELEVNVGPATESNFYSGFDGTVANGGVFVATYDTVAVDTPVALTITLPGGFIAEAHGYVRFVRDIFDFDAHADPGVGVQFEAMTRESLGLIERFADKRPPIFFD